MRKSRFLVLLFSIFIIAVVSCAAYYLWLGYNRRELLTKRQASWRVLGDNIKKEAESFGNDIGVVIEDLSTGWRIAINENKLFPSASLIKVPIMASYFSFSLEKGLDLKQSLVLTNRYKVPGSGILKNCTAGAEFNIEDLIEIMVVESDNTATNMLIDYLGFDVLNDYFRKLGLNDTVLTRKMMDFESRKEGMDNFTSASDLAYILRQMYYKRLINKTLSQRCLEILKRQRVRDRIPAQLPFDAVVAHKTGLEKGICHDAGIIFTPKGDFIVCVLTKHNYKASRPVKRFISRIALDVYNCYQSDNL